MKNHNQYLSFHCRGEFAEILGSWDQGIMGDPRPSAMTQHCGRAGFDDPVLRPGSDESLNWPVGPREFPRDFKCQSPLVGPLRARCHIDVLEATGPTSGAAMSHRDFIEISRIDPHWLVHFATKYHIDILDPTGPTSGAAMSHRDFKCRLRIIVIKH